MGNKLYEINFFDLWSKKMELMKQNHLLIIGFVIFLKGAPFSDFVDYRLLNYVLSGIQICIPLFWGIFFSIRFQSHQAVSGHFGSTQKTIWLRKFTLMKRTPATFFKQVLYYCRPESQGHYCQEARRKILSRLILWKKKKISWKRLTLLPCSNPLSAETCHTDHKGAD